MYQTVLLKQHPELRRVILAAFPNYRKLKASISTFRPMSINSYWDGGSRDEYAVVDIAARQSVAYPSAGHPYFDVAGRGIADVEDPHIAVDHVGNVTLKHLPLNYALVKAGTFCGKPSTACVYVNDANLIGMLPEAA